MIAPQPLNASAAKNLVFALGSFKLTNPVGCTYTHSMSTVLAPTASANLIPEPSQWSPLVVEKFIKSGLCYFNNPPLVKSAPYPPVAIITVPNSYFLFPSLSTYSTPITSFPLASNLSTLHFVNNLAHSPLVYLQISSYLSNNPMVTVIPGNFSFPLCVLSWECPPNLLTKDRSIPNELINQSIAGPLSLHKTSINLVG